ncbi:helix-turn-helix transcriptional regulator [Myxococcus landrumensis]|uniref:Helix-turn-helix transcriptional regulator n=1 Tax=Myxococcus landrumensis TaxID=2813577 RepID=A0ABX7N7V5_9BACT|nr:helix-turn-helix transcriptional regulator [Myxococcus landrumus]QSQ14831.1 helix-turn-helix transcriptional regulator [Myxococcus landrumus]
MDSPVDLTSLEARHFGAVMDALLSSCDLPTMLGNLRDALPRLVAADCVALCVSRPGSAADYEWMVSGGPAKLLNEYAALASDDFVRPAVLQAPGTVLRDSEMLPSGTVKETAMFRRSQQLALQLHRVQAVVLTQQRDWHAGLTLYRNRDTAFSDRDRDLQQMMTPLIAKAVINCRHFETQALGTALLDELMLRQDGAYLVVDSHLREKLRTPRAQAILERWFKPNDLDASGLPTKLVERLRFLDRTVSPPPGTDVLQDSPPGGPFTARFSRLPSRDGSRLWALTLYSPLDKLPFPHELEKGLTLREREVLMLVLENLEYKEIAERLGITLLTARTHIKRAFKKLSVDTRDDLLFQIAKRLRPV